MMGEPRRTSTQTRHSDVRSRSSGSIQLSETVGKLLARRCSLQEMQASDLGNLTPSVTPTSRLTDQSKVQFHPIAVHFARSGDWQQILKTSVRELWHQSGFRCAGLGQATLALSTDGDGWL